MHIFIVRMVRILFTFLKNFCKCIYSYIYTYGYIYIYEVRNLHRSSDKQSLKNKIS